MNAKVPSGYTMVFGGPDFEPETFLRNSRLNGTVVRRGDRLRNGEIAEESWLEFSDIREGRYPLDLATELLDRVREQPDEFVRLSRFEGVMTRTLSFFGDAASCSMELEPRDLELLYVLALRVSIDVAPGETERASGD